MMRTVLITDDSWFIPVQIFGFFSVPYLRQQGGRTEETRGSVQDAGSQSTRLNNFGHRKSEKH